MRSGSKPQSRQILPRQVICGASPDPQARLPVPPTAFPVAFHQAESLLSEESVGYLMKRVLGSIVHQVDARLCVHALTNSQWVPLLHLNKSGTSTVAELARRSQVDAGAMTRLLDRLEKKQLCKRDRSTTDRRVVHVAITPQGAAAVANVPAVLAEVLNAHLAGFTRAEWLELRSLLRRMADNGEALRQAEGPDKVPPARRKLVAQPKPERAR